jgi:hypothetical protein
MEGYLSHKIPYFLPHMTKCAIKVIKLPSLVLASASGITKLPLLSIPLVRGLNPTVSQRKLNPTPPICAPLKSQRPTPGQKVPEIPAISSCKDAKLEPRLDPNNGSESMHALERGTETGASPQRYPVAGNSQLRRSPRLDVMNFLRRILKR